MCAFTRILLSAPASKVNVPSAEKVYLSSYKPVAAFSSAPADHHIGSVISLAPTPI